MERRNFLRPVLVKPPAEKKAKQLHCNLCAQKKPESEFYDPTVSKCIECVKKARRDLTARRKAKEQAFDHCLILLQDLVFDAKQGMAGFGFSRLEETIKKAEDYVSTLKKD